MLRSDDIEAAVKAGVITPDQAAELERIVAARHKRRAFALGREERFRLLGGFNDFFIAVGVALLGAGLFYGMALFEPEHGLIPPTATQSSIAAWFTFGVLVMWGLSEYLTGRLRLVAPSIVIVVLLAVLAGYAVAALNSTTPRMQYARWGIQGTAAALTIAMLHYARFRLPFSLLVIAIAGVFFIELCYAALIPRLTSVSYMEVAGHSKWVALVGGILTFAAAMWFDTSDPERITRRADCAFWLHIVAAPLIVHPLAAPLISHPVFGASSARAPADANTLLVFPLVVVLAFLALIVDRRALLVAGLGYLGAATTYSISKLSGAGTPATLATLFLLGMMVIVLGVGWREIRGALMRHLPEFRFKHKLPPYVTAA